MNAVIAITVLLTFFALGEYVAYRSKALLSTTLVVALVIMVAFWLGMPKNITQIAQLNGISMVMVSFLITSMGTTMNFRVLKNQWKTVVISVMGVIFGVLLILLVGSPLLGREQAFASAPIFAGGNAAALILKDSLAQKGLENLFGLSLMVLILQSFIGLPIASYLLRREARVYLTRFAAGERTEEDRREEETHRKLIHFPESLQTPTVALAKMGMVAILGHLLAKVTGGLVHPFVGGMLLGIAFTELGFLEPNILKKSESGSLILFIATAVIFSSFAQVTPKQVLQMLLPTTAVLVIGVLGVILSGLLVGKLLHVSPNLTIALGLTCTFGFPATMYVSKEVSRAVAKNKEEEKILLDYLLPKMLTAGFVTVTIASVIIAGLIVKML